MAGLFIPSISDYTVVGSASNRIVRLKVIIVALFFKHFPRVSNSSSLFGRHHDQVYVEYFH